MKPQDFREIHPTHPTRKVSPSSGVGVRGSAASLRRAHFHPKRFGGGGGGKTTNGATTRPHSRSAIKKKKKTQKSARPLGLLNMQLTWRTETTHRCAVQPRTPSVHPLAPVVLFRSKSRPPGRSTRAISENIRGHSLKAPAKDPPAFSRGTNQRRCHGKCPANR